MTTEEHKPLFLGRTLLGGSMLLRLAVLQTGVRPTMNSWGYGVGFCISGQEIRQLQRRLTRSEVKLNHVMVMIGTNDFKKNREMKEIKRRFSLLLRTLYAKCKSVVVLTIPPIPYLGTECLPRIQEYNDFIAQECVKKGVQCIDVYDLFLETPNSFSMDRYERFMGKGSRRRRDLHWNERGMAAVVQKLYMELPVIR